MNGGLHGNHPRSAKYKRARQKQILISHLFLSVYLPPQSPPRITQKGELNPPSKRLCLAFPVSTFA